MQPVHASALDLILRRPIAHRGYHGPVTGHLENTLPAFEAAIRRDFAIECDVQLTADGEVVVFHDAALNRLTLGAGAVAETTLPHLRAVRFRAGEATIPTLGEFLDLVAGRVPALIELKTDIAGSADRLAGAVAERLVRYAGPVALMSFEPAAMAAVRRIAPGYPRGMIVDGFAAADHPGLSWPARFAARHLLAAPMVEPQFVACDVRRLPARMPALLRRLGRPLLAWTVRTSADRALATRWADQIIFEGFDPDA